jgi:thymidylate synthase (FAD)
MQVTLIDHMGSDLSVVNAARVSFNKKSDWAYDTTWGSTDKGLSGKDKKLIQYLAKHKHMSPFGHAFLSFHVKAPIFVARQLVKHKFLRWNEVSRRYVDEEPEFFMPDTFRFKAKDKKQGSTGDANSVVMEDCLDYQIAERLDELKVLYQELIERDICPEQARMFLPQSTMTEWYWSGSLDAFASMCTLRCAEDTQYETRVVADQISEVIGTLFPVSWQALKG